MESIQEFYNKELNDQQKQMFQKFQEIYYDECQKYLEYNPNLDRNEFNQVFQDDRILISILKFHKFNIEKSINSWKKWFDYLNKIKISEIRQEDVMNEIKTGGCYFLGKDLNNNLIILIRVKQRIPGQIEIKEIENGIFYMLREALKIIKQQGYSGKMVIIWDRQEFTKKNHDDKISDLLKKISDLLQEVYLEFLDKIYILFPNWFFRVLFAIYKPFISDKFKNKFSLLTSIPELIKCFDLQILPKEQGGIRENPNDFVSIMAPFEKNYYFNNSLIQNQQKI